MKKLWDVVSFMAIANLLAILVFGGWLLKSGRLSRERLESIRTLLAPTVAEAQAELDAERALVEAASVETAAAALRRDPPRSSAEQVAHSLRVDDQAALAGRRLEDQKNQHLDALKMRSLALDERESELVARQQVWEASIGGEAARRIDDQFQKTVKLYEALAGKQAKRMLLELVGKGQIEQAVTYLDAMTVRAASKTLKEMKTDEENELATRLLERVRVLGIEAEIAETAGNDDVLTSAQ